jgi:hypothetical protein
MRPFISQQDMADFNGWADFRRNKIGVNVIPAKTRIKRVFTKWQRYQNSPFPEEQHNSCNISTVILVPPFQLLKLRQKEESVVANWQK